jgi:hypothetical protein
LGKGEVTLARSGDFLETMGLCIAGGTVLGASTLPFYDQPGTHSSNLAVGAAVGAVAGLGIWAYGQFVGPDEYDEYYSTLRHTEIRIDSREVRVYSPLVSLNL